MVRGFRQWQRRRSISVALVFVSSSSIGKNGDESDFEGKRYRVNIKEAYDGFDALEKVLPITNGISKFYCERSKSFTSLSSIKDIG